MSILFVSAKHALLKKMTLFLQLRDNSCTACD